MSLVLRGPDQHTCDAVAFFWIERPHNSELRGYRGAGYKAVSRPADLKTKVGVGTVMITCSPYRWRCVRSREELLSESPPICSILRIDTDLLERRCWRDRALLDLTFAARSSDAASRSVAKICGPDCSTCSMAYRVIAYMCMAYSVMAYGVMAYVVMDYTVMASASVAKVCGPDCSLLDGAG